MSDIYYSVQGQQQGPVDEAQLRTLWEQGSIPPDALYWRDGMDGWLPLAEFFPAEATAPGVPPPLPAPGSAGTFVFTKDPTTLTKVLKVMLWVYAGVMVVSMLSDLAQISLLRGEYTEDQADMNDFRQMIVGILIVGVVIATAVVFLMWIHRMHVNTEGFGAQGLEFTPGWSVGWFFVPIMNLFRPYQAMKELWQASKDPHHWSEQQVPALVSGWWGLWILSGVLGQVSFRLAANAKTVDEVKISTVAGIVEAAVDLPLCVVAVLLVSGIYRMQAGLTGRQA